MEQVHTTKAPTCIHTTLTQHMFIWKNGKNSLKIIKYSLLSPCSFRTSFQKYNEGLVHICILEAWGVIGIAGLSDIQQNHLIYGFSQLHNRGNRFGGGFRSVYVLQQFSWCMTGAKKCVPTTLSDLLVTTAICK